MDQLALEGRNLVRPDRAGPRLAIGEGRVTMSWTRDAAVGMESRLRPGLGPPRQAAPWESGFCRYLR